MVSNQVSVLVLCVSLFQYFAAYMSTVEYLSILRIWVTFPHWNWTDKYNPTTIIPVCFKGGKGHQKVKPKLLIRTWSCCQLLYSVLCSFWLRCIPWTGLITWCRTTCYTGTYLLVLSPGVKWLQVFSSLKLQVGLLCEVLYCTCVVLLSHCCGLGRYQIVEGVLEELGLQHEHRAIGLFFILFRLRNVGLEQDIREVV